MVKVFFGFFTSLMTGLGIYDIQEFRHAVIKQWYVKVGDRVKEGDLLCSFDTDKASLDLPCVCSGVVAELLYSDGEEWEAGFLTETHYGPLVSPALGAIEIGEENQSVEIKADVELLKKEPISVPVITAVKKKPLITALARKKLEAEHISFEDILKKYPDKDRIEAEDVDLYKAKLSNQGHNTDENIVPIIPRFPEETDKTITSDIPVTSEKQIAVLPAARRRAKELGIDLGLVKGSGVNGLITLQDVEEASQAKIGKVLEKPVMSWPTHPELSSAERIEQAPMMRKTIAALLQFSKLTIPHAGDEITIDVTDLKNIRDQIKSAWKQEYGTDLKYDHFIMYFIAQNVLPKFSVLNAYWDWGTPWQSVWEAITGGSYASLSPKIMHVPHVNLGIAVQTNEGLVVPVVHAAEKLNFAELVSAVNTQIAKALAKKCTPADFRNLSVTVNRVAFTDEETGELIGGEKPEVIIPCTIGSTGGLRPTSFILAFGKIKKINARDLLTVVFRFDHRITDGATPLRFVHTLKNFLEKECAEKFEEIISN